MRITKCKGADRYTAKHPPRCGPCETCKTKWEARLRASARKSAGVSSTPRKH